MTYADFFERATGHRPFPYQLALATGTDLPARLEIPTGMGKTAAAVLAWAWRRRHPEFAGSTPRRLVFCLPMRTLVEQTWGLVGDWLERLGLAEEIALAKLLGGDVDQSWDISPEQEAVLVGTQDMLLSRALNRGYAMSRYRWPLHFGLLNNDALWVIDEVQLMGPGLATTTQLQALRRHLGTVVPTHTLWMSATFEDSWLRTVDVGEADVAGHLGLSAADRERARDRLQAHKHLEISETPMGEAKALAQAVIARHQPGQRTLVICNTVRRAVELHEAIAQRAPDATLVLLHSRFRTGDRVAQLQALLAEPGASGTIAVCTQVIEAGVDVSSRVLFTELAPWASLVQRFGRCNRFGEHDEAEVIVLSLPLGERKTALPYAPEDLQEAARALASCAEVGPARLPRVAMRLEMDAVLRRRDLLELFDNTPELMGGDTDVSRFIRDADDRAARVLWRDLAEEGPLADQPAARREELCSAPLPDLRALLKRGTGYRWDPLDGCWRALERGRSPHPGMTMMVSSALGGYSPRVGFKPGSKARVSPVEEPGPVAPVEQAHDDDVWSQLRRWYPLEQHLYDVAVEADRIATAVGLDGAWLRSLVRAARWHDVGKAHAVFQASLRANRVDAPSGLLAKSVVERIRHARPGFRHELASALQAMEAGLGDLEVFLIASHHGKVRMSIRPSPHESPPDLETRRFARGVWDGDELPDVALGSGEIAPSFTVDLSLMELGGGGQGPSWAERMLRLRDDPDLGPFRLAYLEALLKAADERASAAIRGEEP